MAENEHERSEGRPSFEPAKFWLPPFLLALTGGAALLLGAHQLAHWGYAVVLGVPFALGSVLGYAVRTGRFARILLGLLAIAGLAGAGITLELSGLLCGLSLASVFIVPMLVGLLAGTTLRRALRSSTFSQRWYLHASLLFLATGGLIYVEHRLVGASAPEVVRTTRVLPVEPSMAWDSLVFYEEVRHTPPLLARLGLPHPLYTSGDLTGVGDLKTCVYDKGRLVKRVTAYHPERQLGFDVVEQRGIEDRSIRLLSGSFQFEPLGPTSTRVTLTTVYEPLLSARLVWRPFERRLARSLHEHVLLGIELETRAARAHLASRVDQRPRRPLVALSDPGVGSPAARRGGRVAECARLLIW